MFYSYLFVTDLVSLLIDSTIIVRSFLLREIVSEDRFGEE